MKGLPKHVMEAARRAETQRRDPIDAIVAPCLGAPRKREKRRGVMNGLERAFAEELESQRLAGVIKWWGFELMKFRLATGAQFTPDFVTCDDDLALDIYETKGSFCREAARLRLKVAASKFPWPITVVRREAGRWKYEIVLP